MKKPSLVLRLKAAIAIAKAGVAILRDLSLVAPHPPRKRRILVDFAAKIPAKSCVAVQQQMQSLFRGTRLVVTKGMKGTSFVAIFVGGRYQLPIVDLDGAIDCDPFAEALPDPGIVLDTCQPGQYITIWVRNKTDQDVDWHLIIFGDTLVQVSPSGLQ